MATSKVVDVREVFEKIKSNAGVDTSSIDLTNDRERGSDYDNIMKNKEEIGKIKAKITLEEEEIGKIKKKMASLEDDKILFLRYDLNAVGETVKKIEEEQKRNRSDIVLVEEKAEKLDLFLGELFKLQSATEEVQDALEKKLSGVYAYIAKLQEEANKENAKLRESIERLSKENIKLADELVMLKNRVDSQDYNQKRNSLKMLCVPNP